LSEFIRIGADAVRIRPQSGGTLFVSSVGVTKQ
jgi:hypothetical protein